MKQGGDTGRAVLQPGGSAQASGDLPLFLARQFLPAQDGTIHTADSSPENLCWLAARFGASTVTVVDKADLRTAMLARFGAALLEEAIFGLARRTPALSAHRVVTKMQARFFVGIAIAAAIIFCCAPLQSLRVAFALLSLAFLASALFRGWLAFLGAGPLAYHAPAAQDRTLPVYTVMVPLYREAAIMQDLARALAALAYPADRLDIKLVVEEDDTETAAAARATGFETIAVPPGGPRTKPKAANYALSFARGEFLVIYDAEDRPEPDQLLKAVAAFRNGPRQTACLQARLNFYNAGRNWLTHMFALDYALWFDVLLPGLDRIAVPMPLGGTSNHFRTAVLREIGGWDAFNVTEDADIGIRLSQHGYRVAMLDSTTFEECPVHLGAWLRQRSRWLKGYMQTWLVHMRDPVALARRTGLKGFFAFQLFIGGGVLFALANPLLWAAFLAGMLYGHGVAVPGSSLLITNLLFTYLAMIGPRRRGWDDLSPYGLTVIAYWAMVSVAAYRGLWQLITRPFYWDKTTHGLEPG